MMTRGSPKVTTLGADPFAFSANGWGIVKVHLALSAL
jgi:hypothetical protein